MRRRRQAAGFWLGAGLAVLAGASPGQGVVTGLFQKGVSPTAAYDQCRDSTLRSLTGYSFGMQSLGDDAALDPRWSDSEGSELVWFDVSSLPPYASVSAATLRVRFAPDEFEVNSGYLAAFRLRDPAGTGMWQENTNAVEADYGTADPTNAFGCAAYKRPNVAWGGSGGRVTDVTGGVARAWHVAGTPEWIALDVTADVQEFLVAPASNLGWLVRAEADDTLRGDLSTCEATNAASRPQLEVVYAVPDELPPTADAGGNQTAIDEEDQGWMLLTLDGSGSTDPDGWIEDYSWSTGGVEVANGEIVQVVMPFGTNGVSLVVTDNDGLADTDTVQIVVRSAPANEPPTARAGADQVLMDTDSNGWEFVELDGSASTDPDGWIADYIWSTGGVEIASGEYLQEAMPLGTNGVTLTVTDDDDASDDVTIQIVIRAVPTNAAPVLSPIGNQTAWTGYELRFALNATDADGDSVLFTASNLPPGATFLAPQFTWTPLAGQTGVYAGVGFHADDQHGGTDSEPISITVREPTVGGTTWYVRVDGGSPAQCTGRADAPYPGSGSNQPCAWDHPFRALPPGAAPRIAGGDTLLIGLGSYRMGYGAPETGACTSDGAWDCHMPPVPGGPNPANPTRILGAGWASGCTNPPELWGAERSHYILNLIGATNVEIGCLELTDHSGCVEFHSGGLPCQRDAYPFGDWAERGIYAEDARNVYLHDLDIHGLAFEGIQAGRLADWTVENVRVAANGWAGWDGDIAGDDGNSGTMAFRNFTVEWNGCAESYPAGAPTGCWAQSAGGYGDGLGTGETGGEWIFEDSAFLHNTSDGLDLLYVRRAGSSIAIRHTRAEGNAGNQLKTSGPASIENCIAVGNCGFFEGRPFTYFVDPCRALGNTLSLALGPGDQASIVNCTVTGEGDCLVLASPGEAAPDGTERVVLRNNVFLGQTDYLQPFENACLSWAEGFTHDPFDMDYALVTGVKNDPCPVGDHDICGSLLLADMSLAAFDATPLSNSPAIDAGEDAPDVARDIHGRPRPLDGNRDGTNRWDIGAVEYVHPLADSDGDSARDVDEIEAGTDATNSASFFALDSIRSGTGPVLNWWGVAGRLYDIEDALAMTGAWTTVEGATNVAGTNGAIRITNAPPDATRYYRVRVRRP